MAIPDGSEHFRVRSTFNVISDLWINWRPTTWHRWVSWAGAAMTIILFYLTQSGTVSCSLDEIPRNVAVVSGSNRVQFKCRSDRGYKLKWWMQSPSMSEGQALSDGLRLSKSSESFCRVENGEPGKFDLNLVAKEEAAQTYTCDESDESDDESSADLIIILAESAKKCVRSEKSVCDGHVILKCSVEFRGNWAPELEWSFNGKSIEAEINSTIVPNELVSSVLVLPLNPSIGKYTCKARFDIRGKPPKTTATNVPDFVSSSVLTVETIQIVAGDQVGVAGASSGLTIEMVVGAAFGLLITAAAIVGIIYCRRLKKQKIRSEERG